MSHIAVVFDARGVDDGDGLLNTIEAAIAPGHGLRVLKQTGPNFAAINVLKPYSFAPEQPFFQADDCLLIDGALYEDRPNDDLIRDLFSADLMKLDALNGQFNAVVFRARKNELTIVTDRLGYRPLYYAVNGLRHVVSSEIRTICTVVNKSFNVSPVGLIELFAFGHNVGTSTLFDEITVLPPGSVITINSSGARTVLYHHYKYSQPDQSVSPQEWGERVSACLKAAAPKYLRGPSRKGMFLSGGLDSRIVAGALGNAGAAIHAYTFGNPESRDARFAREIASRMGFQHDVLPYPSNYLSKTIRDVVMRTECAAPFYHATSVIFHDSIAMESDSIFVGFCGDALSGGHLKRFMLRSSPQSDTARQIFHRALHANSVDIAQVFNPLFFKKYWPEMIDAFHASVNMIDEAIGANVADVWDMQNRQRRFTFSSPKVDRHRFEVVAPLLDKEFVDLMTSLPIKARWQQSAYRHAIVDGFPKLRSVPWTRTGRPVPSGPAQFWVEESRRVGSKAYQLARIKVGLGGSLSQDKYKNIANDMRHDESLFPDYLCRFLSSRSLPEEIFNLDGIKNLVEGHKSGKDYSHLLGMVMTVAVYLESITG